MRAAEDRRGADGTDEEQRLGSFNGPTACVDALRTLEGKGTKGIVRSTFPLSGDGLPARLLATSVWASDVSENWLCDRTNCLLTRVHVRLRSLCGLVGSYWT